MHPIYTYICLVKKTIAIFLVLAIAFQVSSKLVVAGWFSINQQELTELFCVNKQKPETHCDGKCYLAKKLKEADQETSKDSSSPVKVKSGSEEVLFCGTELNIIVPTSNQISMISDAPNTYFFQAHTTIFQPPRA